MSLDTDLQQPIQPEQTPPAEPAPQQAQPPVDEEAQLDAELEEQAIEVPDGDKLVPLSAVTTVRAKYKTAKQEARDAKTAAEHAVEDARQTRQALDEARPWIEAAKSLAAARQMVQDQPHQPPQPDPREQAELDAIAKDYDLYQGDGTPDLPRAKRILDRERRVAQEAAQQHVAPLAQQSVQQQSQQMLARAMATTKLPNGRDVRIDPGVLKDIWGRLDPNLTATKEGAQWAFMTAVGASELAAPAPTTAPRQADQPPLYTERAGGRDTPANVVLDDHDKRIAKDLGITEKEYAESASKMPWAKR